MFGLGLHFTLLLWIGGTSSTQGAVLASAEAGRPSPPIGLPCYRDTVHQVRWLDKDNKLLLAYQPGASIRVSHQDSNVQLVSWQKNSSSITIIEVRLEHEGCFRCIFDVFPAGSQEGIDRMRQRDCSESLHCQHHLGLRSAGSPDPHRLVRVSPL